MSKVIQSVGTARHFRQSNDVVSREIAGEILLVPIHRRGDDVGSIFVLNEVAARVWELVDGSQSLAGIVETIVDEFEVTEREAAGDVESLADELVELGLLREIDR